MQKFFVKLSTFRSEKGQTMAEYGVVLAVITLALIGAFGLLSDEIKKGIDAITAVLKG